MSLLTNIGKLHYLQHLKDSVLHFGFGLGVSNWGTRVTHTANAASNGEFILPHQVVSSLIVTNLTSSIVGTQGTPENPRDYFVDFTGGVVYLTAGFAPVGNSIQVQYNHGFQSENPAATDLISRQLNKVCLTKSFVSVDSAGSISVGGVKYSQVVGPTRYLYVAVWLEPTDYPNGIIREVGVFINPTLHAGLPEGQLTFSPSQITAPGTLVLVANYPTIVRNAATRALFDHIIALPTF